MKLTIAPWVKATLVAAVGGAVPAGAAALMDPVKFGIKFGSGHLLIIMAQGAAVAIGALFLKSPMGREIVADFGKMQAQAKEDTAMLDKVKGDIKTTAAALPAANAPTDPPAKS